MLDSVVQRKFTKQKNKVEWYLPAIGTAASLRQFDLLSTVPDALG